MVDAAPEAEQYCTDGYLGYLDVVFQVSISSISTTKTIPSQWRVSMLICAIIFLHWHGAAGAFHESWKIFRRSLLYLSAPITALAS